MVIEQLGVHKRSNDPCANGHEDIWEECVVVSICMPWDLMAGLPQFKLGKCHIYGACSHTITMSLTLPYTCLVELLRLAV